MSRKKCFLTYTVLFFVIFFLGFITFFIQGKSFVWEGDGFRQYYPALVYLGRYYRELLTGIFTGSFQLPMVDYTIGQGEDIITTFANYGLGDPLTAIGVFVPARYTEILYGILVAVRLYLSGVSFLIYSEGMRWNRQSSVYGALVYTFCGFAVWSVKDPFFLNAMIYLPLILYGIERVVKKRKPLPLMAGVLFSALSGYYFFYMIVVGAIVYFAARAYRIYGRNVKSIGMAGLRCLAAGLAGVMTAGALVVPLIYGFAGSSRTKAFTSVSSLLVYDFEYYKNMLAHLFMVTEHNGADSVGYFSMSVVVFAALYLLVMKRDRSSASMRNGVIWCILAVASPFVGYVMNGFGYVTNRFMFIPAFVLSVVLVRMLPELLSGGLPGKRAALAGAAVYGALCLAVSWKEGLWTAIFTIAMLGGLLAVLFYVRNAKWRAHIVYGLIVLNLVGNINLVYGKFGAGMIEAYLDAGSVYGAYTSDKPLNAAKKLAAGEDGNGLQRIDVMLHGGQNPNQAVVAGYPGVSVYYSVVNAGYSEYMTSLGNGPDLMFSHRILGNDGRTVLENLANVTYVVSRERALVPYGFEPVAGKKNVYVNRNRTSIGSLYDQYVSEADYDGADVFERQDTLLESAVLDPASGLYARAEESAEVTQGEIRTDAQRIAFDLTDTSHLTWENGRLAVTDKNGSFRLPFVMKPGREYYLRFKGLELTKGDSDFLWAHVKMGKWSKSILVSNRKYDFYFGRDDYVINLGSLPEGTSEEECRELKFRINGPAEYDLDDIELVEAPVEHVSEKTERLCAGGMKDVSAHSDGSITGTVPELSEAKLLCLAIPYKKGFTLYVDGKQADLERMNKMYMGAWLEPGAHDIRLTYETPGLLAGWIVTVLGILLGVCCLRWKLFGVFDSGRSV